MPVKKEMTIEQWVQQKSFQKAKPSLLESISIEYAERRFRDAIQRSQEEPIPIPAPDYLGVSSNKFWFFKGYVYDVESVRRNQQYSDDQIQLLILEHFDKERKKFERLNRLYKSDNAQEGAYRRERIPEHVRIAVWRRYGGKCARCGRRERLEYDHIVPVSKGGSNTGRNIELLCEQCNRKKGGCVE